MNWLFDFVSNPNRISTVCAIYIVAYYFISIFSIGDLLDNNFDSQSG